jgi:hypothetical protein
MISAFANMASAISVSHARLPRHPVPELRLQCTSRLSVLPLFFLSTAGTAQVGIHSSDNELTQSTVRIDFHRAGFECLRHAAAMLSS